MHYELAKFLRRWNIHSYQEIRLLLLFCQNPDFNGTYYQFCKRLYLGDCAQLEEIIHRFHYNGLLENCGGCYKLIDRPEIRAGLDLLARAFDEPLARQQLLDSISKNHHGLRS